MSVGPWFPAGFESECSAGGETITEGAEIRADGDGSFECRECVEEQIESILEDDGDLFDLDPGQHNDHMWRG